jgi:hypothetical protein
MAAVEPFSYWWGWEPTSSRCVSMSIYCNPLWSTSTSAPGWTFALRYSDLCIWLSCWKANDEYRKPNRQGVTQFISIYSSRRERIKYRHRPKQIQLIKRVRHRKRCKRAFASVWSSNVSHHRFEPKSSMLGGVWQQVGQMISIIYSNGKSTYQILASIGIWGN